ncbi:predicted protein [Streptomyces viridochromogenes DSM 40736]|uniref:Predicted protein n=1 Tax=Streptomyces viridochromogenes (strain DSM 40736 / JCM 4977 / BCRC 1201 / Tue 494) TaxID=591159 RepID=D9X3U4_STRVT|nr:predicted protein [Streptomyces viridochromogenes DSM 40736]
MQGRSPAFMPIRALGLSWWTVAAAALAAFLGLSPCAWTSIHLRVDAAPHTVALLQTQLDDRVCESVLTWWGADLRVPGSLATFPAVPRCLPSHRARRGHDYEGV